MKFSIEREVLLRPLQEVIGAVERKQTLPILGNVLIEASDSGLLLTASDSEIEVQSETEISVDSPGATTVPARKLLDICRSLKDNSRMDIELSGEQVKVKSGRTRFSLATMPAGEFPKINQLQDAQTVELKQSVLAQAIKATSFSMAQQDVRFYLNGMLVEINQGRLCCVATDGHRLAYSECETDVEPEEPIRAILPRKSVNELTRLIGSAGEETLEISITKNHLQVALHETIMTTKLIDGRFPDYNRVIPIDVNKELLLNKESLRATLQRAAILSSEKYRGVRLAVEQGVLTVSSNNPDREEAIDELEIDYAGEGAEIGFNVTYLLDVLGAMDGENARILLKDSNSSALVMPEAEDNTKYVIMPMRL